jgi:hypothetical protein
METGWDLIRKTRLEARRDPWSDLTCFILGFTIVFGLGWMVIEQLPDPSDPPAWAASR